jgi:hypothetical protein
MLDFSQENFNTGMEEEAVLTTASKSGSIIINYFADYEDQTMVDMGFEDYKNIIEMKASDYDSYKPLQNNTLVLRDVTWRLSEKYRTDYGIIVWRLKPNLS